VIVDRTVLALMLRGVMTGRRTVALGLLALLPVIAAVFVAMGEVDPGLGWARLVQRLVLPVVTAFVAVVIAAGAVADQREDGTILYLASTPVRRITLAACAVVAGWAAALAILVPTLMLSGLIVLGGEFSTGAVAWPLAAVVAAALAYSALGVLAAMVLRQPVVAAVLYILLWEGTFATWTQSAEYLSVAAYARAIAVEGVTVVTAAPVSPLAGAAMLILGTAGATALAARRLSRAELP
jgi:ABC-2 type transport system permease protein